MHSHQLVSTLNKMQAESQTLYDKNQKAESSITKTLIETLAKAKLDSMTVKQVQGSLDLYK